MPRESLHIEPHGAVGIARHYIRDVVYGANDGIITTFAVVAGVAGGALSTAAVWKHGVATLLAFVAAGVVPLVPYMLPAATGGRLLWSTVFTMASLFGVGAARAAVTRDRWWQTGPEMLMLGGIVAAAAYGAGALAAALVGDSIW